MIGRILVGLGGQGEEGVCCTRSAIRFAVDIAADRAISLTGVTVADAAKLQRIGPAPIGASGALRGMREHRLAETRDRMAESIAAFEEACRASGLMHRVKREERGEPLDFLISLARYHDLTVLGLHGLFEYGVPGEVHHDPVDTMLRLIRGGVRPLIAVGPHYPREGNRPVERVLVAYSGSPESAKTMRRFVQMRLWPDALVRVVAFGDDHERRQRHLLHAANYFEDHGIEVERDYRPGDAKAGVLGVAHEWGADLIVMGNSHRTLLSRKMLGDTMMETIRKSDIPLFLSQ
ncbi:MAG: universal stress protein [Planctomycetota bacterium]